jgi:hypothetical protein
MKNLSILIRIASVLVFSAALSVAVDTHVWEQSDQADFARGTRKGLSIRSDGHLVLAPEFKELDSTGVPYLWAIAQDSKGTVYYGGGAPTGATTKIFALAPGGKPKTFTEVPGLEVHALAVDKRDRLYAAVLPDAKIYRIDAGGKPQLFFDPKCKYIWAMAFDRSGNLFAATGDSGLIYKVAPDGQGSKFFDTQQTHARSLTFDDDGNLIVGTEPGGLILRITPAGKSFVLYQASKREITAVAVRNGVIYAAAIGSKPTAANVTGTPPVLPPSAVPQPVTPTGAPRPATQPPAAPPAIGTFNANISGGSDLFRIQKDGFAEPVWTSATDLIYAIGFDRTGKPLLGTGNKGLIYRVDSDHLSTELLDAPPTQVTAFLAGHNGAVYAVTGNVGNLYSIGPALAEKGTIESEVLDAHEFALWGKAHLKAALHGGSIALETRSGNVNNPETSWSSWSAVQLGNDGGPVQSPPARFLQYRLTFGRSGDENSPDLSAIDIPFLPKNVAPRVEQIEIAPFNYRQPPSSNPLERSTAPSGSPLTITLPAVGRRRAPSTLSLESAGGATLQYAKGYLTLRWSASDPNSDPLIYKVEIREQKSNHWIQLKDKLQDRFYAFDTTAFPDGQYIARITASDAPGNVPGNALASSLESDSFTIDNTAPEITGTVSKNGGECTLKFTAKDALSWIDKAEYSVDGGEWILLQPDNSVTDSQMLNYTVKGKQGQTISVRVFDEDDNSVVKQFSL